MNRKVNVHNISIIVLCCFFILLPVDAALGNIVGTISIINYIGLFYALLRIVDIFFINKKIHIDIKNKKNIYLYGLYFILSIFWRINIQINSFFYFSFMTSFIIAVLAIFDDYSPQDFKKINKSIILSTISLFIMNRFFASDINGRLVLNEIKMMDPNFFSCGLILLTGILFNNFLIKKNKMIWILLLMYIFYLIMLTGSRGGLISNLIVVVAMFFTNKNISLTKKLVYTIVLSLLIVVFVINIESIIPTSILSRFSIDFTIADNGAGRFLIWKDGINIYKSSGFIRMCIGYGPGTYQFLSYTNHAAHNIYLQSLIEGGGLGMILLILMIYKLIKYLIKEKNYTLLSIMIGIVVAGFDIDLNITRFFWICIFLASTNFNSKIVEVNKSE